MTVLRPLALVAVLAVLAWHVALPDGAPGIAMPAGASIADPAAHARSMRAAEVRQRFDQAVLMLHAREYEHAATALHRVLELDPGLTEAHVNMGFALLGLARAHDAREFFAAAIERRATQANAYYGLALAHEAQGDLPAARGAMRAFLHLARADDPYRTKARAALWEWETAPAAQRAGVVPAPR